MKLYANLKMNMNFDDMIKFKNNIYECEDLIIFPSSLYLNLFENNGAQDVSIYDNGSYTGDISAKQLSSSKVKYCIIGHSERRKYHNEDNETIKLKLNQLINNDITPILCIGENIGDNKEDVLSEQLSILNDINKVIIAYEPVWAIGTGLIPSALEISKTVDFIKLKYGFKVLYGGSVDTENIKQLSTIKSLDGFLVGKASCDFNKVNKMLDIIRQI